MRIDQAAKPGILILWALPMILSAQSKVTEPHALVYKTKKDYSEYVAVELSADKKLISYPAPNDVTGRTIRPTKLHKGYLLSNNGISTHTAYLKMKNEAYAKLIHAPTQTAMLKMIKTANPLTELYDCGSMGARSEAQLNAIIDKVELRMRCKKVQ